MKTYWIKYPRNFRNEYNVGIATDGNAAADYREKGYDRIMYREACKKIDGDSGLPGEICYGHILVNGREVDIPAYSSRQFLKEI